MSNSAAILSRIESLCDIILVNVQHPSRLDKTEANLRLLQTAIADYFEARFNEPPPDLGIDVNDSASMGDIFG